MLINIPTAITKKYRACISCSLISQAQTFKRDGCPNCPMLELDGRHDNVIDATCEKFNGIIGLIKPGKSWVAKWQRINNGVSGIYAMTVDGTLPDEYVTKIENCGGVYRPRDKSFTTK